jgi:hypothetical protein
VKAGCTILSLLVAATAWAAPPPETLDAWQRYVAQFEARRDPAQPASRPAASEAVAATGQTVPVPSGTISHWSGSIFVRGATLDQMLDRLMRPGTPPPQEDVIASTVLGRDGMSLRVYMRLVRRAIVTATYDTEHQMTFTRRSPTLAIARSVATRIEEVGGDRGFLWRLHSYWRYEQRPGGVRVDLESLTLSRDVPSLVRPVAMPIVNRIARESIVRTLEALRRYCAVARTEMTEGTANRRAAERTKTHGDVAPPGGFDVTAAVSQPFDHSGGRAGRVRG